MFEVDKEGGVVAEEVKLGEDVINDVHEDGLQVGGLILQHDTRGKHRLKRFQTHLDVRT